MVYHTWTHYKFPKGCLKAQFEINLNFSQVYGMVWSCFGIWSIIFNWLYTRHRDRIYLSEKHILEMVDQVGHDVSGVSETTMVSLHIELQRCAPALDMFLLPWQMVGHKIQARLMILNTSLHCQLWEVVVIIPLMPSPQTLVRKRVVDIHRFFLGFSCYIVNMVGQNLPHVKSL